MGEIEALLAKYNFTGEVDAKEFLDKLLFQGNNNYLDQFRSDFKNNLLDPVSEKFKKFYGALNKKLTTLNDQAVENLVDPFGLSKINKEYESTIKNYKANMEKFLNKKFETSNEENEKNAEMERKFIQTKNGKWQEILENNRRSFVSAQTVEEYQKQQDTNAAKQKVNQMNPSIQNAVATPVNRLEESAKPGDQEQKSFGPAVTLIDFSKNGKVFLIDLVNGLINKITIPKSGSTNEKQAKDGVSSWWLLILGIISDLILASGKLSKAFEWLIGLPSRVLGEWEEAFKSSKTLMAITEWFGEKWNLMVQGIKDFIKFDDISAWLNTKWTSAIEKIKEFTKFDEVVETITRNVEKIMTPIRNVGEFFENTGKTIEGVFAEGGRFGELTKFFGRIGEVGEGVVSIISRIRGPFAGIIEMIAKIAPLFEVLEKLLGPIALLIDPVIDSFTVLFDVFGNDKLSFVQKATAVLTAFIGGFGDIIVNITDWIAKLSTGAFSWLTGKGFKTDNAVSRGINKFTNGESLGVSMGKNVIKIEEDYNRPNQSSASSLVTPYGQAAANAINNGQAIPTEDAVIDAASIQGSDGNTYVPSKEDTVIASKPDGALNKSLMDLRNIMMEVNKGIQKLNEKQVVSNNVSSINVSSQGNKNQSSSRDLNYHAREEWWRMTSERGLA